VHCADKRLAEQRSTATCYLTIKLWTDKRISLRVAKVIRYCDCRAEPPGLAVSRHMIDH
jgi:hypothetical protein